MVNYDWPVWPEVNRNTVDAVAAALYNRRWAIASSPSSKNASYIDRVESELAALFGRSFCITTCNGSAAIVIALQALGIGPGDRVLVPALTWIGCATAILRVGAIPVYADSGDKTPLMEVTQHQCLELSPINAILAVHLYASQLSIETLQQTFPGVPIIEDCSHCQGAQDASDRPTGTLGDIAICSFQASKILTCGEGGAAFTNNPELAHRLAALRADSRVRPAQFSPWRSVDLEPSTLIHGSNFAMSEIAAGVLLDQLTRFPHQTKQRAQTIKDFQAAAMALGLEIIGDEPSFEAGAFYGVMVRLAEGFFDTDTKEENFLRQLQQRCGIMLSTVYPVIPQSPLYRPLSLKQYAVVPMLDCQLTRANQWHQSAIVVPHWAFLAPGAALVELAYSLADLTRNRSVPRPNIISCLGLPKKDTVCTNTPEITVVIITNKQRVTLPQALASAINQDYQGIVKVLVVTDQRNDQTNTLINSSRDSSTVKEITIGATDFFQDCSALGRIARLRNLALEFVDSPLVCFLDDDNLWDPYHLSSLQQVMAEHNVPAVHSWRRLINQDGTPWQSDCFPWLPPGDAQRNRYNVNIEHGIICPGSAVVRDTVSLPIGSEDFGMVDMGAWLLDIDIIKQLRFATSYSQEEIATVCGEDDKFLRRLRELGIGSACTNKPTLIYRLGGISNTFLRE